MGISGFCIADQHAHCPNIGDACDCPHHLQPPSEQQAECPQCQATPVYHAGLHAGHIWTNMQCPAYTTLNGDDCNCREAT